MMLSIRLLWDRFVDRIIKDEKISEETKIIYAYRYSSWGLTSIVYLTGKPYSIILFKLGVIISLFISSRIITDLYIRFKENKKIIGTLVLIETIGITLLLFPTGGLNSPFIWYALNPTLVAASYLMSYYCWLNLTFYLFAGTAMSYLLFNPSNISMWDIFISNSNLSLVFILITLAVQLLASAAKKLNYLNKALQLSNIKKQESMEHIMSLYQIIEALNNHSTKEKLFKAIAIYAAKLTNSYLSFFWLPNSNNGDLIKTNIGINTTEELEILSQLGELKLINTKDSQEVRLSNRDFLAMPIISATTYFGIIAIQKKDNITTDEMEQDINNLQFLADLSAVTLERFNLEDIEDHLLVMEEQNRIANEIHDSVSQRLFSISYAIHGALGRLNDMSKDDIRVYLSEMKESSNLAMQELRNSIYKLSSKKKGERSLQVTLKAFLDSIEILHQVIIDFDILGDESVLSLSLKKGITRIIREASCNAVRHGKCEQIHIDLNLSKQFISLNIADNGIGFIQYNEAEHNQKGLGLSNMKNLVNSFNGVIEISSEVGQGTEINITIPNEGFSNIQHGGLAI